MEQTLTFEIDLIKIEGEGDFPCPCCGTKISPDDESGIAYEIFTVESKENGSTKEIVVTCRKCGSIINLRGFEMLNEIDLDETFNLDDYLLQRLEGHH